MTAGRKAFTLVEMLIVTGIMILLLAMALPAIRSLSGTRSISLSYNILSAVITKAREEAIALQQPTGVLFYSDQATGRVVCMLVQAAQIQDTKGILNAVGTAPSAAAQITAVQDFIALDAIPNMDSVMLPLGVGIQTIFNGMSNTLPASAAVGMPSEAVNSATGKDDRYLGFNAVNCSLAPPNTVYNVGGCILFDGNGKLIQRPYGFQMLAPSANGAVQGSNLAVAIFGLTNIINTTGFPPASWHNPSTSMNGPWTSNIIIPGAQVSTPIPTAPLVSQIAFVLFDHDTFLSLGFSDNDPCLNNSSGGAVAYTSGTPGGDGIHSELDEETWLDANSTPIMINRYNGTLIRGE